MEVFFSIVMPAYNVEQYIGKAIESIQAQTYQNFELIVVDDCTPDKSGEIARSYAETDERIRVIRHEKNKGLSAARNTGEKEAKGAYIWFMDSDDFVDADLLENVYASLLKNPAKLVVFGLQEEYYDKDGAFGYRHEVKPKKKYCADKDSLRKEIIYLEQSTLYGYAWNKFYDLAYLRELNLKYENVRLIEDILFNVKYCMDIDSMNLLDIAPYHYQKRLDHSLTNKFVPDYYELHKRRIELIYEQHRYWNLCTAQVRRILGSLYGRYLLSALQRNCDKRAKMTHAMRYKWCKGVFHHELFKALLPAAQSDGSMTLRIALRVLKTKKAGLCLLMGRVIYIAREKMPLIYSKVKSGR